jgi:ribose 5-phosphate isomerase B
MKIALACDHAGFALKEVVAEVIRESGHTVTDLGTDRADVPVDYPDFGAAGARSVARGAAERAVLICGTGLGMAMAANKLRGVRAAHCANEFEAEMSRRHNDANVLCLGARTSGPEVVKRVVQVWLASGFDGGRHARRVRKIAALEREACRSRREPAAAGAARKQRRKRHA